MCQAVHAHVPSHLHASTQLSHTSASQPLLAASKITDLCCTKIPVGIRGLGAMLGSRVQASAHTWCTWCHWFSTPSSLTMPQKAQGSLYAAYIQQQTLTGSRHSLPVAPHGLLKTPTLCIRPASESQKEGSRKGGRDGSPAQCLCIQPDGGLNLNSDT